MARKWKVRVEAEASFSEKPEPQLHTLRIEGLTQAQIAFIRCMLQCDYEVDPVADLGFKSRDGDLQSFRHNVAVELEKRGF